MPGILTRANQVLLGAVVLVQMVFLVTGASLFPGYWHASGWDVWMPIYFMLTAGTLVLAFFFSGGSGVYSRESGFSDPFGVFPLGLLYFAMGFALAIVIFQFIRVPTNPLPQFGFATVMLVVFVIGFTETMLLEWLFIGFAWPVLKWWSIPASGVAAIAFHLARYGGDIVSLAFIFILFTALGLMYAFSRDTGGAMMPWGFHGGYDLGTMGVVTIQALVVALGVVH